MLFRSTSDINRRYFTKMRSSAGFVLAFPDKAYLIIDFRYIEKARNTVSSCEVIEQEAIDRQITELMKLNGAKTLAIESMDMTVSRLEMFRLKLTDIEFITTDELSRAIYDLRTTKTDEEIEKIQKAQQKRQQKQLQKQW